MNIIKNAILVISIAILIGGLILVSRVNKRQQEIELQRIAEFQRKIDEPAIPYTLEKIFGNHYTAGARMLNIEGKRYIVIVSTSGSIAIIEHLTP